MREIFSVDVVARAHVPVCTYTPSARTIFDEPTLPGTAIPHCTGQWSDIFTIGSAPVLSLQETSRLAGVLNGGAPLNNASTIRSLRSIVTRFYLRPAPAIEEGTRDILDATLKFTPEARTSISRVLRHAL